MGKHQGNKCLLHTDPCGFEVDSWCDFEVDVSHKGRWGRLRGRKDRLDHTYRTENGECYYGPISLCLGRVVEKEGIHLFFVEPYLTRKSHLAIFRKQVKQ